MLRALPKQVIQVGDQQVELPPGVSVTDWALERISWQNPRIRSFLGCLRILQGVLESNYSILHCSPARLLDIWRKVRKVAALIRGELAPLLSVPSRIPSLEEARQSALLALRMVERHVLAPLDRFPDDAVPPDQMIEVRKLLCVSIGQLHSFLQDTFGEVMAGDPRSLHEPDYFLSKRFPQDVEEAEWLHASVIGLQAYLERLEPARIRHLASLAETLQLEQALPDPRLWEGATVLLDVLLEGLTPKLKEVLALRGIRFYEIEVLDRYAGEIPTRCRMLLELHETSADATRRLEEVAGPSEEEREQSVSDLWQVHTAFSRRMARLLSELDQALQDLATFVVIWLDNIAKRRALLLRRSIDEEEEGPGGEGRPGSEGQISYSPPG